MRNDDDDKCGSESFEPIDCNVGELSEPQSEMHSFNGTNGQSTSNSIYTPIGSKLGQPRIYEEESFEVGKYLFYFYHLF